MAHAFDPTILREYDIRGVFGTTLGVEDAQAIGRSFGTLVARGGPGLGSKGAQAWPKVVVGYDGRLSSPMLESALITGLIASGVDVVSVGLGPTPMLYYAEASMQDVQGGIQITGSHNPADHNGFKMVLGGAPFFGADIQTLGAMAAEGDWDDVVGEDGREAGCVTRVDILDAYVTRLLQGIDGLPADRLAAMRIGWDAGNGAAGPALELLTSRMPGEHHLLFTQIDGTFPNHHPDPTEECNLADLRALVAAKNLDFGVAFDGDADRLGVVDGQGRVIWGDQLLGVFAEDLLRELPNATVIADIKASRALFDTIAAHGGKPLMWKTGHSLIKAKMQETGAPLAGEMTGHVFFKHGYYGFDDGLYAAVRLIAASLRLGRTVTELRGAMPEMFNTPELRFRVDESRKFAAVEEVRERLARTGAEVVDLDGVRVTTSDGWWLLRASNTQDVLVARAESGTAEGLERLLGQIDEQLALSGLRRG
ncbi:phosphomannomutase [Novosphingobium chloroacetimidivorans]|uniref:Phosphomannomutase n=1 Tax=Novosphingobium chloroacetimidivorans TaxID=1428314 RepID=A0A7W7K7S8_9SPHN|nr:phosphomannomutase/phosphoglucomutase [Novosphingobium chloroacetimidivorans]MBB4857815.1 phosphomannomutase [Novosphingobium chloroacetimidivorans]